MAEAMELDLTVNQPGTQPLESIVPSIDKKDKKESTNIPSKYQIETYYMNDSLGSDILKQKYLAPWEKHAYELWQRQAKALASVEKNK
ncbi:MAG: hypothetical protein VYC00_03050, partial [Candidatus Neomarinimicrobiota bacterium]|nr:hypothetical protein [Candidatus Neomarinimicrobiota bacterium]